MLHNTVHFISYALPVLLKVKNTGGINDIGRFIGNRGIFNIPKPEFHIVDTRLIKQALGHPDVFRGMIYSGYFTATSCQSGHG